jgi:hypothetical protein
MASLAEQYAQYGVGQAAVRNATQPVSLTQEVADYRAARGLPPVAQPVASQPMSTAAVPADMGSPANVDGMRTGSTSRMLTDATQAAANSAAQMQQRMDEHRRSTNLKALLGGAAGGLVAGPLGGILGNLAVRSSANQGEFYQPAAPSFMGRLSQLFGYDPGNGGVEALSDEGREVYKDSKQFESAVNSGKAGLW